MKNISMYEKLHEACLDYPRGLAVYYQGKRLSFAKLDKLVDRTADILQNTLGIKAGDIILVAQPNIPQVLIIFYALNKIGAITNFVHPLTPYNQVKLIITKTNAKLAFLFEQCVAKEVNKYRQLADMIYVTRIEDYLPLPKRICYHLFKNKGIRKKLGKRGEDFPGFRYFHELKPAGKPVETYKGDNSKTSILIHSGSTTGEPKTICLNNIGFNYLSDCACECLACTPEFIRGKGMLSVLPSFHGFGLCMTMHTPLCNRFASILMPKFDVNELVKIMNKAPVTCICGVPVMYEKMMNSEAFTHHKKLKNLHVAFCGGDTLPASLKEKFDSTMKEHGSYCRLFEGYGLTEAIAVNCVNTYDHNRDNSIGYPLKDTYFRIVDQKGEEVKKGTVGEIVINSPALMVGYYRDEENKETAIKDGWLYTGDLGYMDEEGYVYFSQRKKRVIKVSGVGIFPTEVERLIESIPGVKSCCCIEIPDNKMQHAVKALVVANYFDEEGMRTKIIDTCRKYLIRWAIPKEVEFRKELPLTMLKKVDFDKLQKEEDERRENK